MDSPAIPSETKSVVYRRYLLAVLVAMLAANYVDRLAIGLLLQDIKTDLALSDTQLGFLTGIGFALFYALIGVPIARWADRGDRILIITLATGLWSVAVALCGLAGSFLQLLLIRIGVAVGEAGCIPPAHSLIGDHFTREERPRAVARYMLGAPISLLIGYFIAGWLNQLYGWRLTFLILGLPGLVLAPLAWLTLREPRRAAWSARLPLTPFPREPSLGLFATFRHLWRNPSFRNLLLCWSVASFFSNGITQWKPAFFMRSYALDTSTLGIWLTLIYGIGGLLGTWIGGELAARRAAGNERLQLNAMALAYGLFGLVSAGMYLATTLAATLVLMSFAAIGGNIMIGPLFATIQTLVSARMRATAFALVYLFGNLIGMGLGPLAVGGLSDLLHDRAGQESLRYALLLLCPGYGLCTWLLWRAGRSVAADLVQVEKEEANVAAPERSPPNPVSARSAMPEPQP